MVLQLLRITLNSPTPDSSLNFLPIFGPYLLIFSIIEDNFLQISQGFFEPSFLAHLSSSLLKHVWCVSVDSLNLQISSPQFTQADMTLYMDLAVSCAPVQIAKVQGNSL